MILEKVKVPKWLVDFFMGSVYSIILFELKKNYNAQRINTTVYFKNDYS